MKYSKRYPVQFQYLCLWFTEGHGRVTGFFSSIKYSILNVTYALS